MKKYKGYWYEVKECKFGIKFCFYDTEDRMRNAWCFNAELFNFKQCIEKIKEFRAEDKKKYEARLKILLDEIEEIMEHLGENALNIKKLL